jgi:transcriptional regulator with XRE-family HTH domain
MFEIQTRLKELPDHVATGREFRKQRMAAGLYQSQVAVVMGIKGSVLSDLERGKRKWTEAKRGLAAEALRKLSGQVDAVTPETLKV